MIGTMSWAASMTPEFIWNPKEDLTAIELAQALRLQMSIPHYAYAEMPTEVQRHFQEKGK